MIRLATEVDVPALRRLLVETWHATYDAILGADRVTGITDIWHAEDALRRQIADPGGAFLIAEHDGALVGHCHVRAQPDGVLYLGRLYVHPDRQRRGLGRRLLHAALACHPDAVRIWLTVAADNAAAVAFYRGEGYVTVGETIEHDHRVLRMERTLTRRG